jgi:hypothetical protein
MNLYRVAVVGSRNGVPENLVSTKLDNLLGRMLAANRAHGLVIVSGGAGSVLI